MVAATTPTITVVVGLDRPHLREFGIARRSWSRFAPWLFDLPWVMLMHEELDICFDGLPDEPLPLEVEIADRHEIDRRELMLSAFVLEAPKWVVTDYYLKIDTDAILTAPWSINPAWFAGSPAIIAPTWGYSKPADSLERLDAWAATKPAGTWKRPTPVRRCGTSRVYHDREISYVSFIRTDFAARAAELAGDRLPVPSQDGYHSYVARRLGEPIRHERFPEWHHVGSGSLDRLKRKVDAVLA